MKRTTSRVIFFVFIEIFLLINLTPAESYIIREATITEKDVQINEGKNIIKGVLNTGLNLLIGFLSIKQIGTVSALEGCCEKLNSGGICQEADQSECSTGLNPDANQNYRFNPSLCSETEYCKVGWCYDDVTGSCSGGSPKQRCISRGGAWSLEPDPQKCDKGCCWLDENTQYTTQKECEVFSKSVGRTQINFDRQTIKEDCKFYSQTNEGACVYTNTNGQRTCSRESEFMCRGRETFILFRQGLLCSNPELATNCVRQSSVGCDPTGETPEVYWFDSCGNIENIYSSDRTSSWATGRILTKAQSCDPNDNNKNDRTCGNCGKNSQTICKATATGSGVRDGNFICSGTECEDQEFEDKHGRNPINGESWCVYDAFVGSGKDLPGSTHWIRNCNNGVVNIVACGGDYRGKICAEKTGSNDFVKAQCRFNMGWMCFLSSDKTECEQNPDCYWHTVDLTEGDDDTFKFSACVPQYPKGLDLNSGGGRQSCDSIDNIKCTYVEGKFFIFDDWSPKTNKKCVKDDGKWWNIAMNNLCTSLGDCGSDINIEGRYTFTKKVSGAPLVNPSNLLNQKGNPPEWISMNEPGAWQEAQIADANFETPNVRTGWDTLSSPYITTPLSIGGSFGIASLVGNSASWFSAGILGIGAIPWALALYFILKWVFKNIYKTRTQTISFDCNPWKPPAGSADCAKCNEDPLRPCSEYRCEALGSYCKLLDNEVETDNPTCVGTFGGDTAPPKISFGKVEGNNRFTEDTDKNGGTLKKSSGACINQHSPLSFQLQTNKSSICLFDYHDYPTFDRFDEEGAQEFNEREDFSKNHTVNGLYLAENNNITLYVKCKDWNDNENSESYEIRICLVPEADISAPVIDSFEPASESFLKIDENVKLIKIYTNEPGECKYSLSPGIPYIDMVYNTSCNENEVRTLDHYCYVALENLTQQENNIYIRCNDSFGNMNPEDYIYTLLATPSALKIDSISPLNASVIKRKINSDSPLILEARTSGGVEEGIASCSFKFYLEGLLIQSLFAETDSTIHKQKFTEPFTGNFTIEVDCLDNIGNNATNRTTFSIEVDEKPPEIVRAFHSESYLKLITNEDALCYYSTINCNFNIENGTKFTDGSLFKKEHSEYWDSDKTYYLKCKDEFENYNPGCALIVRPSDI